MTEAEERIWERGNRAAWSRVLGQCLSELGHKNPDAAKLIRERELVIAALRSLCEDFGDNDWDEDLHLADVVEKHLANHLHENCEEPECRS